MHSKLKSKKESLLESVVSAAQTANLLVSDLSEISKVASKSEPLAMLMVRDLLGVARQIESRLLEMESAVKDSENG